MKKKLRYNTLHEYLLSNKWIESSNCCLSWLTITVITSPVSRFIDSDHVFNFLSTYRTQGTFMVFNNDCTLKAHAHVSTGIQDRIDRPFVAHCALTGIVLRAGVHGCLWWCGQWHNVTWLWMWRHGFRWRPWWNTVAPHHAVIRWPWGMRGGSGWCWGGGTDRYLWCAGLSRWESHGQLWHAGLGHEGRGPGAGRNGRNMCRHTYKDTGQMSNCSDYFVCKYYMY
jgi:hypothetical protein